MAYQQHLITCDDEDFWAWFAGFMDADGCITWDKYGPHKRNPRPLISFTQKNRETLDHIVEKIGTGSVFQGRTTPYFHLRLGSEVSRQACAKMLPYLKSENKIEKAKLAMQYRPLPRREWRNRPENKPEFSELLRLRAQGLTYFQIAEKIGYSMETIRRWIRRSEQKEPPE